MPKFDSQVVAVLFYIIAAVAAVVLVMLGFWIGRMVGRSSMTRTVAEKERDLFTAQKGFKQLYETETVGLKNQNAILAQQVGTLEAKVEDYRKKAAGYGGLFNSGGKRADAMYALLLENEALEEQLHRSTAKAAQERTDAVQESVRSAGYRRVLMSQLMDDDRIKNYVAELLSDDKRLPAPATKQPARNDVEHGHEV